MPNAFCSSNQRLNVHAVVATLVLVLGYIFPAFSSIARPDIDGRFRAVNNTMHVSMLQMDKPSLVLSATLQSPLRPPLEFMARMLRGYGSTADSAVDTVSHQASHSVRDGGDDTTFLLL